MGEKRADWKTKEQTKEANKDSILEMGGVDEISHGGA
jgi:hypothetical protein